MSQQDDNTYPWDWEGWGFSVVDAAESPNNPEDATGQQLPYDGDDWPVVDAYEGVDEPLSFYGK